MATLTTSIINGSKSVLLAEEKRRKHKFTSKKRKSCNLSTTITNNSNNSNDKINISANKNLVAKDEYDLPNTVDWVNRPVLVCPNTKAAPDLNVSNHGGQCPIGIPFHFNTDLFEGQCLVRIRDVPGSCNADNDAKYFNGRRRTMQTIVQGRFKQSGIKLSDVVTGHEFNRPLKHLPPSFIVKASTSFIERLSPGVDISISNEKNQPYALSTLAATSQIISVDKPGHEPDISSMDIRENMFLLGGYFNKGISSNEPRPYNRKRYLSKEQYSSQYEYDTNLVYTFDFYQNLFDINTYSLDLGFTKLNVSSILDGQPIQVMSKHRTNGKYLWNFQIWHESLLQHDGYNGELSNIETPSSLERPKKRQSVKRTITP